MLCRFKILPCLLVAMLYQPLVHSQYILEQPISVGKEQGLPTNEVRSVMKGKDGFIWVGTTVGLCRFDGQQVKLYKENNDPGSGPYDNSIITILVKDKEIWMGTGQGISVMSTTNERFRHYQLTNKGKDDTIYQRFDQNVSVLHQDRQGDIWIGTRDHGAWLYDKEEDNFRKFSFPEDAYQPLEPALGTNSSVLSIEASRTNDSIIWVGTTAGLQQINKYSGRVTWYTFPQKDKRYQVGLNAFRRIYSHPNGLLYVGSWEAGVNVFDTRKKTFTPLEIKKSAGSKILNAAIASIIPKNSNELWITTSLGLAVYDINQELVTWFKRNGPLQNKFWGVRYIDDNNRIWDITINGLQYFDPVVQQFSTHSFEHLFAPDWAFSFFILSDASSNKITVCPLFTDGLFRYDRRANEWEKLPFRNIKAFKDGQLTVRGFVGLSEGNYLLSTDDGLYVYSEKKQELVPSSILPCVKFQRWGEILKDRAGNIWISTDVEGLVKWNSKTGKYRVFKKELVVGNIPQTFARVNNFFEDSKNNLWFSRYNGFSVYISARDTIINFLYGINPRNSLPATHSFAEDKYGKIWVSGTGGWYGYINVNDPEKGIVQKLELKSSNMDDELTLLATDKQGDVWGFTNKALVKINKLTAQNRLSSTFDFAYGAKTIDFLHFSFLPSGEMIFGGRNSITIANPTTFKRNTEIPEPYVTGMQIQNQAVPATLFAGQRLELRPRQNFFSISYSAKAFTMPQGLRFRYRLKNFDEWTETNERRFVNYTNVPPGHYVFQLQAANNEGIWNKTVAELPVHIDTSWWQTWLFRISGLLLLAAAVYSLYRYRIRQIKKKEKLKTKYEKKLANVEMSALLAQMNPHFLFNSLNSIDSYIIRNESKKASEYLNNFARLMRLILQNSRSNYIILKDELEALDLYLQMEALRFANRFEYQISIDPEIDTASTMIPPMLIQPYVENAIWHGLMHKKDGLTGKVELRIKKQQESLQCVIEDNGIGREKAQALRDQKSGNRKRSMGMQITKDRIEMINKLYNTDTRMQVVDLKDESGNASGTRVELLIPV